MVTPWFCARSDEGMATFPCTRPTRRSNWPAPRSSATRFRGRPVRGLWRARSWSAPRKSGSRFGIPSPEEPSEKLRPGKHAPEAPNPFAGKPVYRCMRHSRLVSLARCIRQGDAVNSPTRIRLPFAVRTVPHPSALPDPRENHHPVVSIPSHEVGRHLGMLLVCLSTLFRSLAAAPQPAPFQWDPSFSPVPSTAASNPAGKTWGGTYVSAMAAQPDGRVIVAGWFNSVDGRFRPGLARFNPDGSLDPSFDPAAAGCCATLPYVTGWMSFPVRALALQKDGRILVGGVTGPIETVSGTQRPNLIRLNPDGTVDGTFTVKVSGTWVDFVIPDEVGVILVQDDQKILIGGAFTNVAGVACNGLARLHHDGSLDTTFHTRVLLPGSSDRARVQALALRPDGRLLVGGDFLTPNPGSGPGLAQLHPDGSLDSSFVATLTEEYGTLAVTGMVLLQEDGRSLIAGTFTHVGGRPRAGMARLLPDGALDETLADAPGFQPLGLLEGGSVLGYRSEYAVDPADTRLTLVDLSPAGTPAGSGPRLRQYAALLGVPLPDGRWVIAGTSLRSAYVPTEGLALYDPVLRSIDPAFAPRIGVRADLHALAITSEDQIFAIGGFTEWDGTEQPGIARLHANGRVDSTFAWRLPEERPTAILPLEGGESLVAMVPREPEFPPRSRLLHLQRDGTPKDSFPLLTVQGTVLAIAKSPDQGFLVGRDLSGMDGVSGGTLLSVGTDGRVNATHEPRFSTTVRAIAATREGSVMVAADPGWTPGAPSRAEVWRLSRAGTRSPVPFPIDRTEHLLAMTLDPEDRMLIALGRTGPEANSWRLLRMSGADWNTVETLALNQPIHGVPFRLRDGIVAAIGVQSSGALLIAGPFFYSGTAANPGLARYQESANAFTPAILQEPSLNPDGTLSFLLSGSRGTRYEIQSSIDLRTWVPMATHTATSAQDRLTNAFGRARPSQFYRAVSVPP